jgi:hypothetical protein
MLCLQYFPCFPCFPPAISNLVRRMVDKTAREKWSIYDGDVAAPRNPELEALVTTDSLVTTERLITLPSVYKPVIGEKKQSRDALSTIFSVFSLVLTSSHVRRLTLRWGYLCGNGRCLRFVLSAFAAKQISLVCPSSRPPLFPSSRLPVVPSSLLPFVPSLEGSCLRVPSRLDLLRSEQQWVWSEDSDQHSKSSIGQPFAKF